ncbi:MAG TPA: inositol monophosphatase [Deltaproteobacteria bacterium]|nr:inositol monophosphatase [Deltaproteobacteria bacterium]
MLLLGSNPSAPFRKGGRGDLRYLQVENKFKKIAITAAKNAGLILKKNLGKPRSIEYKGVIDIVTEMDRKAEDLIIKTIKKEFPEHGILTEESNERKSSSEYRWIIDPLDGTTNYSHGYPVFCVSIALEKEGEIILGVVYDPVLGELFTAEKDKGAFVNNKKIKVSKIRELTKSLLATGFPYDVRTSRQNNLDHFSNFAVKAQAIRRAGSAALDMCYVAYGRFDGFWEIKLKPWDTAAAMLIIREAGGMVTDFNGGPFSMYSGETLASNGLIHNEMLNVLHHKTK